MRNTQIKRFFKRGTVLLLTAMLVLAALPWGARAEDTGGTQLTAATDRVQVDADGNGNASKVPGSDNHVTLIAIAHKGFVFDHWVATAENGGGYSGIFYGSQITVPVPATGIARFKAYFRLATNPSLGVLAQVKADQANCGSVSGTKVAIDDKTETTTTITATPTKGYEFSKWTVYMQELTSFDSGQNPQYGTNKSNFFYERTITVTAPPGWRYTCTAEFVPEGDAMGVFTAAKVFDKPGGTEQSIVGGTTTGDAVFNQDGIATQKTIIQAFPSNENYIFDHWEWKRAGGATRSLAANPLTVTVENYHDTYTAIFYAKQGASGVFLDTSQYIENAAGSYKDGGGYATGEKVYNPGGGAGQTTTLQAIPASDEFVFDHWEKQDAAGDFKDNAVANPCTVDVTSSHDVYRAVFTKVDVTAKGVFVESSNDAYGTATGGKVYNSALGAGQQTTLQAYPTTDTYVFSHWKLKRSNEAGEHDPISTSNPYTVSVENVRDTYTAVFKAAEEGKGVSTKAVLLNDDGTINENPSPSPGSTSGDTPRTVNGAKVNQTTLQAFPATNGFIFVRWDLHRNTSDPAKKEIITSVSTANPYTVKVSDDNDVYWAVFMATPDNTPVPITKNPTGIADAKNFKDVWRKFTDPNYSVTRGTLESKAASAVSGSSGRYEQADPTVGNSAALTQLEEELSAKGKAVQKDRSEMANLPDATLVSSQGENFVTADIHSLGYLDMADEAVQKRFGKLYDFAILQAVKVTGPAGADDKAEYTLVWKNTGAAYRDRLMLLQFLPNGKQNTVTPIADEDGTLTFTLSGVRNPDFLLLRIVLFDDWQADQ